MDKLNEVIKFEIVDHGFEHEQYFQGCGVAFTEYDTVYTGAGETPADALEDALEQSYSVGDLWLSDVQDERDTTCQVYLDGAPSRDSEYHEEIHYYVSIRVKYKA